jgi:hypothetical protein
MALYHGPLGNQQFVLHSQQIHWLGGCEWFVSPTGDDDNSGTSLEAPLQDLRCLLDSNACADASALAEV